MNESVSTHRAWIDRSWGAIRRQAMNTLSEVLTCAYCEGKGTHERGPDGKPWSIDHVYPHHFGGSSELWNLVKSCHRCNSRKHTKTGPEWTPKDDVLTAAGVPFGAFFTDQIDKNPIVAQLQLKVREQERRILVLEEQLWDAHHALRSIRMISEGLVDRREELLWEPTTGRGDQ